MYICCEIPTRWCALHQFIYRLLAGRAIAAYQVCTQNTHHAYHTQPMATFEFEEVGCDIYAVCVLCGGIIPEDIKKAVHVSVSAVIHRRFIYVL